MIDQCTIKSGGVKKNRKKSKNRVGEMSLASNRSEEGLPGRGLVEQYINSHQFAAGDKLPSIRELAAEMGVKPGTVRDALLDAQGKGLVRIIPRAGTFVAQLDATGHQQLDCDIDEPLRQRLAVDEEHNRFHLLEARELLEVELVGRAVRRRELQDLLPLRELLESMAAIKPKGRGDNYVQLDVQFHLEIARLAGNAVMANMLQVLLDALTPYLNELPWSRQRVARTDDSHANLYQTLIEGDVAAAQCEMRHHLQDAYETLMQQLRQPLRAL